MADKIQVAAELESLRRRVAELEAEHAGQKNVKEDLATSQAQLSLAMGLAKLVHWEYDVSSKLFTFNDQFYALYGTTVENEGGYSMSTEIYARKFAHPDEVRIVNEEIANALSSTVKHYIKQFQHRIICRNGEVRHFMVRFFIFRNALGQAVKLYGANLDVTELKRAEEAVKVSQERLRLKLDSILSPDIDIEDQDLGNILDTPAIQSMLDDYTKSTNIATAILDLKGNVLVATGWRDICTKFHRVHPLCSKYCTESDLFLAQNVRQGEYVAYQCKNNLWDVVTPLYIGGKYVGNIYTGQFLYDDQDLNIEIFADQAARYGFDPEAYLTALRAVPRISRDQADIQMDFLVKFTDMISKLSLSNLKLAKIMAEQKKIDAALRQSEKHFRLLTKHSPIPIVISNEYHDIEYVNDRFTAVLGYTVDDIPNLETWWRSAYPDEKYRREVSAIWQKAVEAATREQTDITPQVFKMVCKDGSTRIVEMFGTDIGNRHLVLLNDITERKAAEEALKESEELFRLIFDTSPDSIGLVHLEDDLYVSVNNGYTALTGFTREEVIGKSSEEIGEFVIPGERPHLKKILLEKGCFDNLEIKVRRKDGVVVTALLSARLISLKGSSHIVFVGRDISKIKQAEEERQKLENQLRQSQKMEAIGTLAGGIAHDFNNILAAIIGNAEMAMMNVGSIRKQRDNLDQILKSGMRAKDLVRQILEFSRRGENNFKPIQLAPIIQDALKLLRSSLPTTIELIHDIDDQPLTIHGNPTQIQQILMNLCTNAAHAMQERGGILQVGLSLQQLDYPICFPFEGLAAGPYACLMVRDTGCGMDDALKERIFEPFFTTKNQREGTGLGLSVVYGIVKSYGGKISVYSEVGKGSTFRVYLPLSVNEAAEQPETEIKTLPRGVERVLLVDDEDAIVRVGMDILQHLGYQATGLTSSREALALFRERPYDFDLLITDQTMPHLTGSELAKEILKIRSEMPILLCTGFNQLTSTDKLSAMGIKRLILKPFIVKEMAETIRAVLDGHDRE
ncbi:MAG: PocR ligand-binding domain-containing protein [Deltaproteobacteria bacterium]|nr:PocR ligand-binding domain-containing protein [Deltaproteobacteria bacterium]